MRRWITNRRAEFVVERARLEEDGAAVDGEVEGFESQCATGQSCPGFAAAFKSYAEAHERATVGAAPAEGMAHARLLVVNDHWRNVGMGFMPTHVANTLVLAMATGIYIYFDNYGRYDWSRYFYGQYGLDLRWTPARRRLWAARFGALGYGGVLAAGFFGNRWELSSQWGASYSAVDCWEQAEAR